MSGLCKDCKHWKRTIPAVEDWGSCALTMSIAGEPVEETLAWAKDDIPEAAELQTHASFGCVQFEAQ